jgi:hypothetical protein
MRIKLSYVTPLLAAGAAAAAIAAAPTAMADPVQQSCTYQGESETLCQSPGNAQINDSPPYLQYGPQYPYFAGDDFDHGGDFGFGGGHGGFGGGHR